MPSETQLYWMRSSSLILKRFDCSVLVMSAPRKRNSHFVPPFYADRIQNLIQSSVPQENFPYYRALAEIEYEFRSRFRIKGDALEILTPEFSTDRSLPPIHEQYL